MKNVRLRGLVGSHGSDLNTVFRVGMATLDKGTTDDGHGKVSLSHNQHSDELFVSVDNEITTQFLRFFLVLDELFGGGLFEMAPVGLSNFYVSLI